MLQTSKNVVERLKMSQNV